MCSGRQNHQLLKKGATLLLILTSLKLLVRCTHLLETTATLKFFTQVGAAAFQALKEAKQCFKICRPHPLNLHQRRAAQRTVPAAGRHVRPGFQRAPAKFQKPRPRVIVAAALAALARPAAKPSWPGIPARGRKFNLFWSEFAHHIFLLSSCMLGRNAI